VLLLYGKSQQACVALQARLAALDAQTGASSPRSISFQEITDDKTEPFGFRDGISQPILRGTYKALRYADPIHLVEPGEFILGYPNNRGQIPPGPFLDAQDDPHASLPVLPDAQAARDLGQDGTFLVIRQLQQDVEEFWRYCEDEATRLRDRLDLPYDVTKDFIGAKLVGRWRDGSALVRHPYYAKTAPEEKAGDMVRAAAKPAETAPIQGTTTKPEKDENDFLFGAEDPEALRCPFGAHIRRANPRDSLDPGSADQIAISNRHRILRIGRLYRPEEQQKPGLMFMCLAGDIERQFEFLQQTWLRNPAFHGLTCEDDALVGDGRTGSCNFTIPTRDGPIRLSPLQQFVTTLGGGYFFLPGRRLLQFLSV
jgi:deferrochelatase/peroxidase EfeB